MPSDQRLVVSAMVTARRAALGGIQFGDADDDVLRRRIRAHANFVESALMNILGVGLLELAARRVLFCGGLPPCS